MKLRATHAFTLFEVALVTAILGIFMLAALVFVRGTNNAYASVSRDTELNFNLRRALNQMAEEIRRSGPAMVTINSTAPQYDVVEFQVPVSLAGMAVTWGAEKTAGWKIQFLVDANGALVRRVVDGGGTITVMDQVLASNIDTVFGGQKGFSATRSGDLLTLTLRVVTRTAQTPWRRQLSTAISLRN